MGIRWPCPYWPYAKIFMSVGGANRPLWHIEYRCEECAVQFFGSRWLITLIKDTVLNSAENNDMQGQTIEKIQKTFGDDAVGKTQIKEWYNWSRGGCTSVDSESHCGRPSSAEETSRNNEMIAKVRGKSMKTIVWLVRRLLPKLESAMGQFSQS